MKKIGLIFILFFALVSINFVLAEDTPATFPCIFKGTITVNGNNTNFHTTDITAYLIETGDEANYINTDPNPAIPVPIGRYYIMVDNIGSNIGLKIKGVNVTQDPHICISSKQTSLDLTATVTNFEGSEEDVDSNIEGLNLLVGDSDDLSQGFFGEQEVEFKDGDDTLITFNYDFDSGSLNLSAIEINKQDENATSGFVEISGISLTGEQTKTVYIDNIANENYVCILDEPDAKVSEMTGDCSNGVPVICDEVTVVSGYTCTDLGDTLKITGLSHSAVSESTYSPPSPPAATGGGGGGGGGAIITTCTEDWSCSGWSEECLDGAQTRVCTDSNSCGTFQDKPPIVQNCVAEEGTEGEVETPAPVTGGVIGALGTGGTVAVAVILIIIVIGLIIIVSRKKK